MNSKDKTVTRRELLGNAMKSSSLITTGLVSANMLNILPVHAETTSRKSSFGANDKLVIGLIGCGGMGAYNMRKLMEKSDIQIAAVCDVDESRMGGDISDVEKKYGKKPDIYKDYRKMLERKDIDAVIVGTPDNWHALNLIHACEAGKDVYCEKPISHDINEAKCMIGAVKHFNKIVQVGTWQRSNQEFVSATEYIRSGKLGKVVMCRAWRTDGANVGHHEPKPVPSGFDYDMWVGPASFKEYVPEYTHGQWRWFFNFGCGMAGDWGVHMMDICLLGMSKDTDLPMPDEVSSFGGNLAYPNDARVTPDTHVAIMKFNKAGFMMQWDTNRDSVNRDGAGSEFISEDGRNLMVWRGGWRVRDADGKDLQKEEAAPVNDHWQNWIDCVKSRQQPRSNIFSMAQTTIVCHLANAAYLCGETVHWDKSKMDIVGRAGKQTSSYSRPYRAPWKLPHYSI